MFKNRKSLARQVILKLMVTLENEVLADAAEAIMQEKNEQLKQTSSIYFHQNHCILSSAIHTK